MKTRKAGVGLGAALSMSLVLAGATGAAADPTVSETTGGVTHTWTNYINAGGAEGPTIPSQITVQIACKLPGFRVADGNTWWYQIASSPWNSGFYASADAFYNNGATSGSLHGTPFVDPAVPDCGAAPASPPPPTPTPRPSSSVHLSQGPSAPAGYRYAMTLDSFAANSRVAVSCRDSINPAGFYTLALTTDASGHAFTQSSCFSADGPDHWVVAGSVESNHVRWDATAGGGRETPNSPTPPSSGGTGTGGAGSNLPTPTSKPATPKVSDPCIGSYPSGGTQRTHQIFGGSETNYDRTASLYQVCSSFGAPDNLAYSPEMKCALIAAAATFGGPTVSVNVSQACDAAGVYLGLQKGDWLGPAAGIACGFFADVFAGGVGVVVAGAASASGPGAVTVGVLTYKALAASLKIACGGLLDGGAAALGHNLEAKHETHVAIDIVRKGQCLRERRVFGLVSWAATAC